MSVLDHMPMKHIKTDFKNNIRWYKVLFPEGCRPCSVFQTSERNEFQLVFEREGYDQRHIYLKVASKMRGNRNIPVGQNGNKLKHFKSFGEDLFYIDC